MKSIVFGIIVVIVGYTYASSNDRAYEKCIPINNGSEFHCVDK